MADTNKPAAKTEAPKKRTVLSPAEKIARLEQQLADERTKQQEKAAAKVTQLKEQVAKATEANRKTEAKLATLKRELAAAEALANPAPQPAPKS